MFNNMLNYIKKGINWVATKVQQAATWVTEKVVVAPDPIVFDEHGNQITNTPLTANQKTTISASIMIAAIIALVMLPKFTFYILAALVIWLVIDTALFVIAISNAVAAESTTESVA